jgi:hypothetical protein
MPRLLAFMLALAVALAAAGCGNMLDSDTVNATLTQHQRDSVIARSALPGAAVVDRALMQHDRATHRVADLDSLTQ